MKSSCQQSAEACESPQSTRSPSTCPAETPHCGVTPSGVADHLEEGAGHLDKQRRCDACRTCCGPRCWVVSLVLLGIVAGLGALLRPRDPDWSLAALNINSEEFAKAMMGGSTQSLNFDADVAFHNPNFVGTRLDPGSFEVYLGDSLMATGTTTGCHVGPRASSSLRANVTMHMTGTLAEKITKEVMASNFHLRVRAVASVVARLGFLSLEADVQCSLVSDAMQVLNGTPQDVLKSKTCAYSFHF